MSEYSDAKNFVIQYISTHTIKNKSKIIKNDEFICRIFKTKYKTNLDDIMLDYNFVCYDINENKFKGRISENDINEFKVLEKSRNYFKRQ